MPAPQKIIELVERFDKNFDDYKSGKYNEAQVRQEFINPLFRELGWDIDNKNGKSEIYKDVIHEDSIHIGEYHKAPDYCMRINGIRKFFVEAKKPSVNVKDDVSPAFQVRRYAWSAKLPLSILTDFEEFAVYDCRVRPKKNDGPTTARISYYTYKDYISKWDEIKNVFSHSALLQGSFDKYADETKKKKGTEEVDEAFLKEIENWRELLAKNIALRNPDLSQRELNYAVQVTIDRLVFLRICEDRGIEDYGRLLAEVNGIGIYGRLKQHFRDADNRYNSGLFHFEDEKDQSEAPDTLTPGLIIDDSVLKEIISHLYYPESPYEFSVLSADILGQVYEQFLGKVIRLTDGHRAKIEEKPEVRKAGGVYYTPTYIVKYIVESTVGKLVEGKTPKEVAQLKICDPACGSGSFLLGAYQFLLDWHLKYYTENDPKKWSKQLTQRSKGDWRLTTAERKRILLTNIFGVDIDAQAVEVTKLSLLLKVLEGETEQSLKPQLSMFKERALPSLGSNIKSGNSLISPDFYSGRQMTLLDPEEQIRINVFAWEEAFPQIFSRKNPGFDAIIGNPPYIRMEAFKELKSYLRTKYEVHDERSDLYAYFVEKEHNLLRNQGKFGMIVSNKFLRANYGKKIRILLPKVSTIEKVIDLAGLPVFKGATIRTIILITEKGKKQADAGYVPPPNNDIFAALEGGSKDLEDLAGTNGYQVPQSAFSSEVWHLLPSGYSSLLNKLTNNAKPLKDVVSGSIGMGIKSGLTEAFVISGEVRQKILKDNPQAKEIIKPFLQGRNIRRYLLTPPDSWLIYTYHGIKMSKYPSVLNHLEQFREKLEQRATKQEWYELQQPQFAYVNVFERAKIIFPDIATECRFYLDRDGFYGANTVYFLPSDDLSLLGVLNSKVAFFYFSQVCAALEGPGESYLRFFGQYLENFPVPRVSNNEIGDLASRMLSLKKLAAGVSIPHEKEGLQRQMNVIDSQIDHLVYELYTLNKDEIKLIESTLKS